MNNVRPSLVSTFWVSPWLPQYRNVAGILFEAQLGLFFKCERSNVNNKIDAFDMNLLD